MKKTLFLLSLCLFILSDKIMSQGHDIKITVKSMANKEVILAHYFEKQMLVADTAKLDNQGVGHFRKNTQLAGGLYLLFFSSTKTFDLIIGADQQFSITTDTTDILNNIQFEGSEENAVFLDFQKMMNEKHKKETEIGELFNNDPNKEDENVKKAYIALFEDYDKEARAYIKNIVNKYPKTTVATIADFTLPPQVPDFSKIVPEETKDRDTEIMKRSFFYTKDHYWDHTNFTDTALIRTPHFKEKLDYYFEKMVIVHPDSLFRACDGILTKARPNKTMFKYLINYCLVYTFDNKIMGMDEAFVKLGEKYYMSGIVDWLKKDDLKKITDEVIKRQYNLLNHKALDLQLPTVDGRIASIYEIKAPYVLILFWEPNCGFCKKTVPEVKKEIFNRFTPHGLKVYAVNTATNKKEWEDYIEKNDLFDFINVWDPNRQSNYWTIYNALTTPVMYILDKDKKIIAKNLAVDQMVDLLKSEYKKQGVEIN